MFTIFIVVLFTCLNKANSQVFTRILGDEGKLETYLPFDFEKSGPIVRLSKIDFESILKEDHRLGRATERFAVRTDASYTLEDGEWTFLENGQAIWKLGFYAPHASSLSFAMEKVNLPANTEMYFYSKLKKIIHGPVSKESLFEDKFTSDVIEDEFVEIVLLSNLENYNNVSFIITGIGHGIKITSGIRTLGQSGTCHFDVNCPLGAGWEVERDAVAKIFVGQSDHCSGALINNQCQDLTANFLTAFHCINGFNISNFVFRFRYVAGTPSCPGTATNENAQSEWIIFNGATLRASRSNSDFALLLMNGNIIGVPNLALMGWNRSTAVPATNVVGIHHPAGDVKKISVDADPPILRNDNNFEEWMVDDWDSGNTEGGSSGSPLFDAMHRAVGQVHRADSTQNVGICGDPKGTRYGRFSSSWTGGGSNSTRLSNWLGNTSPPMTVNSIRVPSLSNQDNVLTMCSNSSNLTVTLNNPIPGRTITWNVTNPTLFATTGGAATSGTTTNATIRPNNSSSNGSSVLTFTLTQAGCTPVTITRNIWIGLPQLPVTNPTGSPAINIGIGQLKTVNLVGSAASTGAVPFVGTWTATGAVSTSSAPPTPSKVYTGNYQGSGNFSVYTSNICGISTVKWGAFNVSGACNPCPKIILNNPVNQVIQCEVPYYNLPNELHSNLDKLKGTFELIDQYGKVSIREELLSNRHTADVSGQNSGVYFVKMLINEIPFIEKVVIIK
jgi:hypothetical protein